jgi:hypothetical protein
MASHMPWPLSRVPGTTTTSRDAGAGLPSGTFTATPINASGRSRGPRYLTDKASHKGHQGSFQTSNRPAQPVTTLPSTTCLEGGRDVLHGTMHAESPRIHEHTHFRGMGRECNCRNVVPLSARLLDSAWATKRTPRYVATWFACPDTPWPSKVRTWRSEEGRKGPQARGTTCEALCVL